ncbi:DinB family protein [Actinopolymorpha rutila]
MAAGPDPADPPHEDPPREAPSREDPPYAADERGMLDAWLAFHRATVAVKCAGLTQDGAHNAPVPTSPTMTAAGLVSHLRWVESYWFERVLLGEADAAPSDPDDPDAEWRPPYDVPLADLLAAYDKQVARSREIAAVFSLDHRAAPRRPGEEGVTLRWILHHLIEETCRHNGHLDIVRELTDGVTGE